MPDPAAAPRPRPVPAPEVAAGIAKDRVGGLFDGIVAITATLLILDVGVTASGSALSLDDLAANVHQVLHWAVSFVMVAVIWTEFHAVFAHSRRWDGGLLVLTFAQMAAISLVPFAADLAAENAGSFLAALVFSVVMGANGLLVTLNVSILRRKAHLHVSDQSHRALGRRWRAQMVVFPASILFTLLTAWLHDPVIGVLTWALCPLALTLHLRLAGRAADAALPGETRADTEELAA